MNLKPLQEDGRRKKFAAAIDRKLEIENESNKSGVENVNKTITVNKSQRPRNETQQLRGRYNGGKN
jgi:hypothetical protein